MADVPSAKRQKVGPSLEVPEVPDYKNWMTHDGTTLLQKKMRIHKSGCLQKTFTNGNLSLRKSDVNLALVNLKPHPKFLKSLMMVSTNECRSITCI